MNHDCKVHPQASIQILLIPLATVFTKFSVRWQCGRAAAHTSQNSNVLHSYRVTLQFVTNLVQSKTITDPSL